MNKISDHITGNVLRHLAAQILVVGGLAAAAAVAKVDYSSLGAYAPMAQMAAAFLASMLNEALGTAPKP